jgi:predicted DNA-binding transcriptional regulator AlpA
LQAFSEITGGKMNQQTDVAIPDPKQVPVERIPSLLRQLAGLQIALTARLVQNRNEDYTVSADRLLKIDEAAQKLRTSRDWLYRNSPRLPFTRRIGRSIRFSERGLELFIQQLSTT